LYGWSRDNSANVHERHDPGAPDILHRGYAILPSADQNVWEVQVPNDDYTVHIVAGDIRATDARYRINVEGVTTIDGKVSAADPWVEGTKTVTVTDGRLTISSGKKSGTNKIDYIDITPFDDPVTLSVAADASTQTAGAHNGGFIFTRTGSVSEAATYPYFIGGSGKAGRDYTALDGNVTFPAGADRVEMPVVANFDRLVGTKTVMVTLVPQDTLLIDQVSATTSVGGYLHEDPISGKTLNGATPFASGTTTFQTTRINFQPSGTDVPPFYKADTGAKYGLRSNGLTYGWNVDNSANTRDHNNPISPDQRYDTLAHMQKGGTSFNWEIAVPNGTYTVRVVAGDSDFIDSVFKINVEGVRVVTGTPSSAVHWFEGTQTVTVSDGRLTVKNGPGAVNNKICFIEIAPGASRLPVVSVSASGNPAEGGGTGTFTFTRTGNLKNALTATYTLGGTAINGTDYDALSGAISIPAGSASASVTLNPIDDEIAEGTESVILNLSPSSSYSTGQVEVAKRDIADNDVNNVSGTLKWSTKAAAPTVRAEAMGAYVNGKVYAFGGYVDRTYHPIARVDVYDVASNTWTRLKDMPFGALTHSGTTTDGNFVYLAGGYPGDPTHGQTFSTTSVWRYDTTNDSWTKMPSLPQGRGAGTLVNVNHVLYFFGGADPKRADASELWSLDLNNLGAGWKTLASMPAPRNHVGGVALNGFIYAIGGQTGQDNLSVFKGDVWRYDPTINSWRTVASLINQPRSHIAAASFAFNGKIVVEGGEGPGRVPLRNVEQYDPALNKWVALSPLPAGRSSGIGVSLGDRLFYTSGYSGVFNNQVWIGTFG
jgi:hypothetical protein